MDGEPWFVLADICKILEITNSRMVAGRLDAEELMSVKLTSGGQRREMTVAKADFMLLFLEVINRRRNLFVNGSQLKFSQQSDAPEVTLPMRICLSRIISPFLKSRIKVFFVCR